MTNDHEGQVEIAEAFGRVTDKRGLAEQLERLRTRAGSPPFEALAKAAGVSVTGVYNWFRGKTAPRDWDPLKDLLERLKATPEEISAAEKAFNTISDARSEERRLRLPKPHAIAAAGAAPSAEASAEPDPAAEAPPSTKSPLRVQDTPRPQIPRAGQAKVLTWTRKRTLVSAVAVTVTAFILALPFGDSDRDVPNASGRQGAGSPPPSAAAHSPERPKSPSPASPANRRQERPSQPAARPEASPSLAAEKLIQTSTPGPKTPVPLPSFGPTTSLVSVESGLCVDGGVDGNDSEVYQWDCAEGATNQQWHLGRTQNGAYLVKDVFSGKCLAIEQTPERLDVVQTSCATTASQQWAFKAANTVQYGGEWYSGYLINSRHGKCLTLSQASHEQRADIGEWDCSEGTRHQMFRLRPAAL
ncbi:RICIN domain-containing protein [Streptomyces tanashiensis]|uniref:RICIN domain-containing protein n=1 Tax=Streptomyces tanashiensis TaxID=67367 RepID=UPI0033FFF6A8